MTDKRNHRADELDDGGGWTSSLLAEEDEFDRRTLWRLGSWGVGTVGALIAGILAAQSPAAVKRDQLASVDAQSRQLQWIAKESQTQARQLAAAVETLNGDRDRLYARVTVLEQNLDSVTGSIARQAAAPTPAAPVATASPAPDAAAVPPVQAEAKPEIKPPPKIAPVASIPSPPPAEQKAASEPDRKEPVATGALQANPSSDVTADTPVQRTAFGVDIGGANSVEGLRALWRGMLKSNGTHLSALQPVVVIREGNDGLGMKLRLVAGPLNDAAAAAKICAALIENKRACEPSVYDGQRLAMQDEKKPDGKPQPKRRVQAQAPETARPSPFASMFGLR